MKIKIQNFILARGPSHNEIPTHFIIQENRQTQIHNFLDAKHIQTTDRGNIQTHIEFSITRHHGSLEAAHHFLFTHSQQLHTLSGDVYFIEKDQKPFILQSATISHILSKLKGTATTHTYTLLGGSIKQ